MTITLRTTLRCALLAFAGVVLAACGQAPVDPLGGTDPAASRIATIAVDPGIDRAELTSRYGGEVLLLDAEQGFALLRFGSSNLASQSGLATEPNDDTFSTPLVSAAGATAWSGGATAWSGGATAWSGGATAWSGGATAWSGGATAWSGGATAWSGGFDPWDGDEPTWSGDAPTSTPVDNARAWLQIDLAAAHGDLAPAFGAGVVVAVVDTGIDLAHPVFADRIVDGWDFIDGDAVAAEAGSGANYGHGTAVAGVVLQVAPLASIMPLRVLDSDGSGDTDDVALAIDWAIEHGADVINLSLGSQLDSAAVAAVLAKAEAHGVPVVASSGNSGDSAVTFPAREARLNPAFARSLVSVGSVGPGDARSPFSTYGVERLDMVAPGEFVFTAFPDQRVIYWSGTSFAAPMVSGALALALAEPTLALTPLELSEAVHQQSMTGLYALPANQGAYLNALGDGRLDLAALLGAALD